MFNFIYKAVVANNPDPIPNPSSALNSLQKHVVEDFSVPLLTVDPDPISNPSFILKAPRQGVIENGPQPLIRSRTDVIIRIYSRDFSASDVVLWRNGPSLQDNYKGHIPGMHAAGIVYMVGPGCKTLKAGDRVVFSPMSPCRVCIFCKSGVFNLCPQRRMMGVPPFDGTLSKYCVITEDLCTILPDNITFEEGALVGCYAIAFHICRRAGIKSGDSVIIFGENTGAYYCAAVARTCGATKVAVVGKGYHPYRQFSDSPEEIAAHIIHKHDLGEGAHVVIEASGMEALMNAGVCVLRSRGMYLQLFSNMYEYDRPMSFPMGMACVKEVVIRGSSSCLPDDFRTAMEMLASGKLSMGEVKKVYEFEDAQQAFEDAQREIQDANLMTCMADPGFQINGPKDDDE